MCQSHLLRSILRGFPSNLQFCFAYGSGVFKQKNNESSKNMLDFIFVVQNPHQWHSENIKLNPSHYAQPLRYLGHKAVANFQDSWGAKVYYNTLIETTEGQNIKYGVISEVSLVEDLLDWNVLYIAGRLHKPVEIITEPVANSQIKIALVQNLQSAIHASLILLPENFSELDFYKTITSLSYNGDFRMTFGEDKYKINNIVVPQLQKFRELYLPVLKTFDQYIDFPKSGNSENICHQDLSLESRIYHLNNLPRIPQLKLVRAWSQGPKSKDTEDCLQAIANDPDSCRLLDKCLREIVWNSSVSQSFKGIFTAGISKSLKYSGIKVLKMFKSSDSNKNISVSKILSNKPKLESKKRSIT